jgi:hypothetical protein
MRRTRQFDNECVQLYAERLLQIAEDAYDPDKMTDQLVQQHLVDIFCDWLSFKHFKKKSKDFRECYRISKEGTKS